MEKLKAEDISLNEFTAALYSKAAVPGGGGASALAGALAAALGGMVGNLTLGKKKYADVEADMELLTAEAERSRKRLLGFIEKDAEAFLPLSKAYSLPKEAENRDEILENCLKDAALAPFGMMEEISTVICLLEEFAEKGSRLMLSDAATGAALARGAMMGAAMNVKTNTRLMKDREYASRLDEKTEMMLNENISRADGIYYSIYN